MLYIEDHMKCKKKKKKAMAVELIIPLITPRVTQ